MTNGQRDLFNKNSALWEEHQIIVCHHCLSKFQILDSDSMIQTIKTDKSLDEEVFQWKGVCPEGTKLEDFI